MSWLEGRGRGARRKEETVEAMSAALETQGVWANREGLAGSGPDSDTVTSAHRKSHSGRCAENGLVGAGRPGWMGCHALMPLV